MAGMTEWRPRFAKQFGRVGAALHQAALDYAADIKHKQKDFLTRQGVSSLMD